MDTVLVTVPMKDRPGQLARVVRLLGDHKVNIQGLAVDKAGVRFLADDAARAVRLLEAQGFEPRGVEVFDVALPDQPGELAKLTDALAAVEVNIVSTFGVADLDGGRLILIVDDPKKARPVLARYHRP